jgi:hypothetical protein
VNFAGRLPAAIVNLNLRVERLFGELFRQGLLLPSVRGGFGPIDGDFLEFQSKAELST